MITYPEDENEINPVTDNVTFEDEVTEDDDHTVFMAQESLGGRFPQDDQTEDELPVVDIYFHDGIWVCLDEGCNEDCHSVK